MIDSLVIGGGPAGILSAIYLARFRRSVVIIDSGQGRAHRIPRSHNYPGISQGVSGVELLAGLNEQVAAYDVQRLVGEVKCVSKSDRGFVASWTQSSIEAKTVVLATGVRDIEPAMPHVVEALRDGALRYCPVCDAFEVIGQRVGILAAGAAGIHEAICLRRYTDRVTVFEINSGAIPSDLREQAVRAGITIAAAAVESLRVWDGRVVIRHGNQSTECDTVYSALGIDVHSSLAASLGAAQDEKGYLLVDSHQRTTVPGVYAIGDVASGLNQISVAFGSAALAASAINIALSC